MLFKRKKKREEDEYDILRDLNKQNDEALSSAIRNLFKLPLIIAGILIVLVAIFSSFYTVDTGSVVIITRFGEVIDVKEPGLNFKIPFIDRKIDMVVREQTVKFGEFEEFSSISVSTKDMQTILLDLTVSNITTDPLKVYNSFTGRQLESLLVPRIRDAVQTNISKYTIEQFISQRPQLAQNIFDELKAEIEPYGIVITNVSITNHDFSDVYENAVEQKKAAEQAVETERATQQKRIVEQEARVQLAELQVEERRLEAEANTIETESITPELLQKWWLEKWNGELPKVTGNSEMILTPEILNDSFSQIDTLPEQ